MNREDMIRMAHEAGWQYAHGESGYEPLWAFAALVASAERKACANVIEENWRYTANAEEMIYYILERGQA